MLLYLFWPMTLKNGAFILVEIARTGRLRAAEQGGHGDVGAHDDQFRFTAMFEIEAAVLGDERHEKGHGAGGDGDADFFVLNFFLRFQRR